MEVLKPPHGLRVEGYKSSQVQPIQHIEDEHPLTQAVAIRLAQFGTHR